MIPSQIVMSTESLSSKSGSVFSSEGSEIGTESKPSVSVDPLSETRCWSVAGSHVPRTTTRADLEVLHWYICCLAIPSTSTCKLVNVSHRTSYCCCRSGSSATFQARSCKEAVHEDCSSTLREDGIRS